MNLELTDILLLGHPKLYEKSVPVRQEEVAELQPLIQSLAGLVLKFRERYGAGRAIAAPQVGVMKRVIVMNMDQPVVLINPVIFNESAAMMELWDDCMSFPNLLVKLKRHLRCSIQFRDAQWQEQTWELEGDLSELLQHEYDHLNGILATRRAIDSQSFQWRKS